MADRFSYDVFLSHNSQDKPRVRGLAKELRAAGLRVWFDEWVIKPGDDIYLSIERGLEAARVQVLCLSAAALASDWVALERSTVLFRDPTNAGRRFIPLLLADCELPDALRRYKYVDYHRRTKAAFAKLLAACRFETESVPSAPKIKTLETPAEQAEPLAVLERTLTGHEGWVRSLAVSPNGAWAASGSDDNTIKIWDLETGECWATLEGHRDIVNAVAITHDGRRILSGSTDGSIRLWDVDRRKTASRFNHQGLVGTVFPLTEEIFFSAGGNTLRLWNISTGQCFKKIKTIDSLSGAISQDGKRAVVNCID